MQIDISNPELALSQIKQGMEDKLWEKRTYWIVEVQHGGMPYKVASLITNDAISQKKTIEPDVLH